MGIYDREYYREDRGRPAGAAARLGRVRMLSVTAWLIIINTCVFVAQFGMGNLGVPVQVASEFFSGVTAEQAERARIGRDFIAGNNAPAAAADQRVVGRLLFKPLLVQEPGGTFVPIGRAAFVVMDPLSAYGHFSTATGFMRLEVWRLVTFQFLHGGPIHLFFNMFALWIFGPLVEQQLGRKRYLAFYLTCGIFGGLMYLVLNLLGSLGVAMPGALHVEIHTPLVGASAGVFGVLMACAYIAPKAIVRLIIPPIPIQMRWFVYGYFALALWNLLAKGHNQGGDAAHVGGALAGYFFIRRPHLLRDFFDIVGDSRKKPEPRAPAGPRGAAADGEIDAILDKINREGLAGLSEGEKRTLAEHSRRERGR